MSAFHRIEPENVESMTAMTFWPRARRLVHYDGAVRSVAMIEAREQAAAQHHPGENYATPSAQPETIADPTPEQIRAMRDAARRKRYPAETFGETRYVTEHDIVREAGGASA